MVPGNRVVSHVDEGSQADLDAKKARQHRTSWAAFAAATPDFPFLAIIAGGQRLTNAERNRVVGASRSDLAYF